MTLLGAGALHLGANVINDVFDIKSGADELADDLPDAIRTGSPFATPGLAFGLFVLSALCGIALAVFRGPLVLIYGVLGAGLAFIYAAPPIALGYRGRGFGELAIGLAFGPIPVAGAFYVQIAPPPLEAFSGPISFGLLGVPAFVWLLGLFPGLVTALLLYHHHFLHFSADRLAGKMTPVAALGPERAIQISRPAIIAAAVLLLALVVLRLLPWWAITAALPLLLAFAAVGRASGRRDLPGYLFLMSRTAVTVIASQAVLLVSIVMI